MNRWICWVVVCCLVLLLARLGTCGSAERYEAKWESLDKRATPQWWVSAKFGIFIRWVRSGANLAIAVPALSVDEVPCECAYVFALKHVRQTDGVGGFWQEIALPADLQPV